MSVSESHSLYHWEGLGGAYLESGIVPVLVKPLINIHCICVMLLFGDVNMDLGRGVIGIRSRLWLVTWDVHSNLVQLLAHPPHLGLTYTDIHNLSGGLVLIGTSVSSLQPAVFKLSLSRSRSKYKIDS